MASYEIDISVQRLGSSYSQTIYKRKFRVYVSMDNKNMLGRSSKSLANGESCIRFISFGYDFSILHSFIIKNAEI